MHENRIIDTVETFCGTSVGSMFALACACKLSMEQIEKLLKGFDFQKIAEGGAKNFISNADRVYRTYGWYSHEGLMNLIKQICNEAFGKDDVTMADLYSTTGKDFIAVATDIEGGKSIYFSHITHPELSVKRFITLFLICM